MAQSLSGGQVFAISGIGTGTSGIGTGTVQHLSALMTCMAGHNIFSADLFMIPNWEKWLVHWRTAVQKGLVSLEKCINRNLMKFNRSKCKVLCQRRNNLMQQ